MALNEQDREYLDTKFENTEMRIASAQAKICAEHIKDTAAIDRRVVALETAPKNGLVISVIQKLPTKVWVIGGLVVASVLGGGGLSLRGLVSSDRRIDEKVVSEKLKTELRKQLNDFIFWELTGIYPTDGSTSGTKHTPGGDGEK